MSLRDEIVAEARGWIGTPYLHQASLKGAGCDCLGLVRGVWREVLGDEPVHVPPYSPDWDEVGRRELLLTAARQFLREVPLSEAAFGDVVLFRMRKDAVAKHLGILTDDGFIHAFSGHGVVENALSEPWRRRIVGAFAF